jgi:hypothetical protein
MPHRGLLENERNLNVPVPDRNLMLELTDYKKAS